MKVNVLRSGGFAGLITGWQLKVDEQPDPSHWISLIDACPWDDPAQCSPNGRSGTEADRYVYEFRAGQHQATLGEQFVQGPWRALADQVREEGQRIPVAELSR